MLENGASFNIYPVHGGTTFGFQGGANGPPYVPVLTSYDWDAPISEAGWETQKYRDIRELMAKHLKERLLEAPARNPVIRIPAIELNEGASLWDHLPEPKKEMRPRYMEAYDQAHGCILYRTKLPKGRGERLVIREPHDYCLVYLDGKQIGTVDRSRKQDSMALPVREQDGTLDLLVEEMGRIDWRRGGGRGGRSRGQRAGPGPEDVLAHAMGRGQAEASASSGDRFGSEGNDHGIALPAASGRPSQRADPRVPGLRERGAVQGPVTSCLESGPSSQESRIQPLESAVTCLEFRVCPSETGISSSEAGIECQESRVRSLEAEVDLVGSEFEPVDSEVPC
jgi:hypothetical protein